MTIQISQKSQPCFRPSLLRHGLKIIPSVVAVIIIVICLRFFNSHDRELFIPLSQRTNRYDHQAIALSLIAPANMKRQNSLKLIKSNQKSTTIRDVLDSKQILADKHGVVTRELTNTTNSSIVDGSIDSLSNQIPSLFKIDGTVDKYISNFSYSNMNSFTKHINFENINFYTSNINNPSHQNITQYRTFQNFNNELACPFDIDIGNNDEESHDPQISHEIQVLKQIFANQFPSDCTLDDPNRKYWIVEQPCDSIGLFATLRCWTYFFTQALVLNRTFIMTGEWKSWATEEYCQNKSYTCFFLPFTNCTINTNDTYNIIDKAKENNQYFEHSPQNFKTKQYNIGNIWKDDSDTLKQNFKQQIWYITRDWKFQALHCAEVDDMLRKRWNVNCLRYQAIIFSYLLRIQPSLLAIVNNIVYDSLINMPQLSQFRPENTISAMIRWGDKCSNSNSNGIKEMDCFTLDEYVSISKEIKILRPDITHIIVTSESEEIIKNITNQTFYDSEKLDGMNVVINRKDIMQGASKIVGYSHNNNVFTVMISMLSTMKLQFCAKYYFHATSSSWVSSIYFMSKYLKCKPIHQGQMRQLILNGYIKVSTPYMNSNAKLTVLKEKLAPLKLDNHHGDVKFWGFDRECVELNSQAFGHAYFDRFVYFNKNLTATKNTKFGDNYTMNDLFGVRNHWDQFCEYPN